MVKVASQPVAPTDSVRRGFALLSFRKTPIPSADSTFIKKVRVFKNSKQQKSHQTIVSLSNDSSNKNAVPAKVSHQIEHIAKNFGELSQHPSQQKSRYYILAVDEKTGKKEIIKVDQPMQVTMRAKKEEEKFEISKPVYDIEHKKRLVQEFGTNKSKRKMNQMMSNIIK